MWTGLGRSFAVTRPVRTGLDWYIYYIIHKKYKKYKLNIIKVQVLLGKRWDYVKEGCGGQGPPPSLEIRVTEVVERWWMAVGTFPSVTSGQGFLSVTRNTREGWVVFASTARKRGGDGWRWLALLEKHGDITAGVADRKTGRGSRKSQI